LTTLIFFFFLLCYGFSQEEEEEERESARMSLSNIMGRFQQLAPVASKLRHSRMLASVMRRYQHVASETDVMGALNELTRLRRETERENVTLDDDEMMMETKFAKDLNSTTEERKENWEDDERVEEREDGGGRRNSSSPGRQSMSSFSKNFFSSSSVLFQPSLAPLGGGGEYQGLGTPKKSLLSVAASMNADSFKKEYSPSMLSPVVQGMSPFASRSEVQVKAQYNGGEEEGRIASSPSLRSRTAVLKTRKGSKLKSEVSTESHLFDQHSSGTMW
jgi:hypothetical protein